MKPEFQTKHYCPDCMNQLYRDGEDFWCYNCAKKYELVKGTLK